MCHAMAESFGGAAGYRLAWRAQATVLGRLTCYTLPSQLPRASDCRDTHTGCTFVGCTEAPRELLCVTCKTAFGPSTNGWRR
jgi:hypothetical protein